MHAHSHSPILVLNCVQLRISFILTVKISFPSWYDDCTAAGLHWPATTYAPQRLIDFWKFDQFQCVLSQLGVRSWAAPAYLILALYKACLILILNSMPSFCHFVTKIRPPFVISFKSIRENSPNTSRLIVAIIIFLQHLPVEKRLWWADGRILSCATPLQILCHSAACCSFKLIFMKHFYAALSESFQCSILQFLHRQTFHRYI